MENLETTANKSWEEELQDTVEQFKSVATQALPKFFTEVKIHEGIFGAKNIVILAAVSDHNINRVRGQHPQVVSLFFDMKEKTLVTTYYGGCGGQAIYTIPQKNPYLAMEGVKIKFRKVTGLEPALKATAKFLGNYKQALKENRQVLMYQDLVDYDQVLS